MVRSLTPAARARKREARYLTPVIEADRVVGWRFNPGPRLRKAGARSRLLKRDDGAWMSWDEAKLERDRALAAGAGGRRSKARARGVAAAPRRTLTALWERWETWQTGLSDGSEDKIKAKSVAYYRSMIKPWLAWGGDELVAAFDAEIIIAEYEVQCRERTHASAHASLGVFAAILSYGRRIGWLARNPAEKLRRRAPRGRQRMASAEEVAALVETAEALSMPDVADAVIAALYTAQRLGDLVACDLGRQLVIDEEGRAWLRFVQSKRGAQVEMRVLAPLEERIAGRRLGRLLADPVGRPFTEGRLGRRYREVRDVAAARLPSLASLQFRDLRDTAITRLHLAGVDKAGRRGWSGHSVSAQDALEAEHYIVLQRESAAANADALDAWRIRKGIKW